MLSQQNAFVIVTQNFPIFCGKIHKEKADTLYLVVSAFVLQHPAGFSHFPDDFIFPCALVAAELVDALAGFPTFPVETCGLSESPKGSVFLKVHPSCQFHQQVSRSFSCHVFTLSPRVLPPGVGLCCGLTSSTSRCRHRRSHRSKTLHPQVPGCPLC